MSAIDIRELGEELILHFGLADSPRKSEIDANTLSNSLTASIDLIAALAQADQSGTRIEVYVEAIGEGSFKVKLNVWFEEFFGGPKKSAGTLITGLLIAYLTAQIFGPNVVIEIQGDVVILEEGDRRVVMSLQTYKALQESERNGIANSKAAKVFENLEGDENITSLGIGDEWRAQPTLKIERQDFKRFTTNRTEKKTRKTRERTELNVLKAWFVSGRKNWQFVWNNISISARITDEHFFDLLSERQIILGDGDKLDVTLEIEQEFNEVAKVWMNKKYTVTQFYGHTPGDVQDDFKF